MDSHLVVDILLDSAPHDVLRGVVGAALEPYTKFDKIEAVYTNAQRDNESPEMCWAGVMRALGVSPKFSMYAGTAFFNSGLGDIPISDEETDFNSAWEIAWAHVQDYLPGAGRSTSEAALKRLFTKIGQEKKAEEQRHHVEESGLHDITSQDELAHDVVSKAMEPERKYEELRNVYDLELKREDSPVRAWAAVLKQLGIEAVRAAYLGTAINSWVEDAYYNGKGLDQKWQDVQFYFLHDMPKLGSNRALLVLKRLFFTVGREMISVWKRQDALDDNIDIGRRH